MTEIDVPSEALNKVMNQIEIIKRYSKRIDESQGLVSSAITQLIVFDGLNAINMHLQNLQGMLAGDLNSKTQDKPRIFVP